jgi:hypothetical protein
LTVGPFVIDGWGWVGIGVVAFLAVLLVVQAIRGSGRGGR